jgi:hypothetical protein
VFLNVAGIAHSASLAGMISLFAIGLNSNTLRPNRPSQNEYWKRDVQVRSAPVPGRSNVANQAVIETSKAHRHPSLAAAGDGHTPPSIL